MRNKYTYYTLLKLLSYIICCGAISVLICGCAEKYEIQLEKENNKYSEYITFTATVKEDVHAVTRCTSQQYLGVEEAKWSVHPNNVAQTKAAPVKNLESAGAFGIYGYKHTIVNDTDNEAQIESLKNQKFSIDGDELKIDGAQPVLWSSIQEDNVNLKVYGYAPYIDGNKDNISISNSTAAPTITYKVPSNIEEQIDIIADTTVVASDYRKSIKLDFDHILTAIRFRMGFSAKVKSVTLSGIYNKGDYVIGKGWSNLTKVTDEAGYENEYSIRFDGGKDMIQGGIIGTDNSTMMVLPQMLTENAKVTLVYVKDGADHTISTDLGGKRWESGNQVTYTLYSDDFDYIYLDLAAGGIVIDTMDANGYRDKAHYATDKKIRYLGYRYEDNVRKQIIGEHKSTNKYYIYQSTEANRATTGIQSGEMVLPTYKRVAYNGMSWGDFITNNDSVEEVICAWDNKVGANDNGTGAEGAVRIAERESTKNYIYVEGVVVDCNLTIDNLYSSYQQRSVSRTTAGISFMPQNGGSTLNINIIGDNRFGAIHYNGRTQGNKLIFGGTGTLTVADTDFQTGFAIGSNTEVSHPYIGVTEKTETTFTSNHWCSAIGNNDSHDYCYGIIINSGTIYAGTTKAENCSAIGGGGNGLGEVTINGGTITAVASTTGTAIGGGIGYNSAGGQGWVTIIDGNVYAYNYANRWDIPSAAIGGAGSSASDGNIGKVTITGGNIYAVAAMGTAIGGGSSKTKNGGEAQITISGGKVVAKSISAESGITKGKIIAAGSGIGGGTGGYNNGVNGGNAIIKIEGNPIIRTGSIGGGRVNRYNDKNNLTNTTGTIGSADIEICGGDIQAQFVMAAGSGAVPEFYMEGGKIRNSNVKDPEYAHIAENGGALYMEDGIATLIGGTITDCSAVQGGAIFIKKSNSATQPPVFRMKGGSILKCISTGNNTTLANGGAIYLEGGNVEITTLEGNSYIKNNISDGGNGGAIYISEGSFSMEESLEREAVISNNHSIYNSTFKHGGNGGAIYVTSSSDAVDVTISSGAITGNSSDQRGGGIAVEINNDITAKVTVGTPGGTTNTNPEISGNMTVLQGGGLYVKGEKSTVTFNDGLLKNNTTAGYVANQDVANEGGIVTLIGGDIDYKNVIFNGNGGTLKNSNPVRNTFTQKIVTSTNNIVYEPVFENPGWTFKGWNTREDGRGKTYTFDAGKLTMNISADITLYAQWEL